MLSEINLILLLILLTLPVTLLFRRKKLLQNLAIFIISIIIFSLFLNLAFNNQYPNTHITISNIFGSLLYLEPIALIFVLMASVLWCCNNLYSWSYFKYNTQINQTRIYFFMNLSMLFTFLIAFSSNLIQTFIFYELLTIATYPLVANNFTEQEKKAAKFYLIFLLTSSMLLFLPAILYLYQNYGAMYYLNMNKIRLEENSVLVILLLYGISKAALVPVHFWLPKAMVAPIPVSAMLHAVAVVKSGIFILVKIFIYLLGFDYLRSLPEILNVNIITILAACSLLVSSLITIYQKTIKKLLAYSTINQLSVCLLALSIFSKPAVIATMLHMVSHAMAKISLFFAAGNIYCHTKIEKIEDMTSLAKKMPITCALFVISTLSIIGIPILAGFVSKAYIMYVAFNEPTHYFVLLTLAISVLFSANYFGRIIYRMYVPINKTIKVNNLYIEKLNSSMLWALIIVTLMVCFFIVIYHEIENILRLL